MSNSTGNNIDQTLLNSLSTKSGEVLNPYEARWGDVLNPFVPPLHYERDLPELLATHKTFWYITCNTGASLPIWEVLQWAQGWEPSGPRVIILEHYSPIMFTAQKYVYKE
jgi:hypothetical protein